jgi:hypothetical protein
MSGSAPVFNGKLPSRRKIWGDWKRNSGEKYFTTEDAEK